MDSIVHCSLSFTMPWTVQLLPKLSVRICHSTKLFLTKGGHCLHFYSQSPGECLGVFCRYPVYRKERRKRKSLFYNYASQNGSHQPHEQINVLIQVHTFSKYKQTSCLEYSAHKVTSQHILCSLYF